MKGITITGIIVVFILVVFGVIINYLHIKKTNILVNSITVQQEVSGNGNNDNNIISTTYKYLVNTDKGTYSITPKGLYHSSYFGTLEENKNYSITTRGYSIPLIGMYPYIIEAYENPEN